MIITAVDGAHLVDARVEIHIVASAESPVGRIQSFLLIILTIHFVHLVHLQLT